MALHKYLVQAWQNPNDQVVELWRNRLIAWRQEPSTLRIDYPTRLDRARALGYKSKQGLLLVRQRVPTGPHRRTWTGGRRSANMSTYMILRKNYRLIAEERANKKFINCEVLNSYFVAKDGKHCWYEIILVDRAHPVIKADPRLSWVTSKNFRGRAFRGLTSAGTKVRGMRHKGKGSEHSRPSRRANQRRQ